MCLSDAEAGDICSEDPDCSVGERPQSADVAGRHLPLSSEDPDGQADQRKGDPPNRAGVQVDQRLRSGQYAGGQSIVDSELFVVTLQSA